MTKETYPIDGIKTAALQNMGEEAKLILRGACGEELYMPVTLRQIADGKVEITLLGGQTKIIDPTDQRISYGGDANTRCSIH